MTETKLDLSKHQTHPLAEVIQNTKLLEAKARQLEEFCKAYNLAPQIGDKFHIMLEGWQYAGFLCQLRGGSNGVERVSEDVYKGFAQLVDINGQQVAHAEAFCTRDESKWKKRPGHALASMANTRAQSKAWRMMIGFIPLMAGFSPTPWEEMASLEMADEEIDRVARDRGYPTKEEQQMAANDTAHGLTEYEFATWCMDQFKEHGIYDALNDDFNGFIKKALDSHEVVWKEATKEELQDAVMDEVIKFKATLTDDKLKETAEKLKKKKEPKHGMDQEVFGTWVKGVIESHGVSFKDMSPKGISEYIQTALEASGLDWYEDSEDDLKEAVRSYTKKVEQVLKDQQE